MLGNIAEQNTNDSAIVKTNDGKTLIAQFDHRKLKNIAPGDPVCVEPTGEEVSPFYWITGWAICNYYRRYWSEDSGGLCVGWGGSTFLFEVHTDGWVSRQIQLFNVRRFILYDEICDQDGYGGRSTERLDPNEYERFRITRDDFFQQWDPEASVNRGFKFGG
ncbi:hypothetical protein SH528x_000962 [Novipirellula sp. SH528]|uniref:hypothetical protein n=1 Tax=Novipirellula sp. SH528 TaxID=3454466 RepID=UPI003FA146DE